MTSVSAGHIIQTPTQPVGSGRPQRESNPGPPHQESRALPQSYRAPRGPHAGQRIFVPITPKIPSDNIFPFHMKRKQFPVRPAFAISSNKAQGQTLSHVGIYLKQGFFSHGELYVAMSRVGSKVYSDHEVYTSNVVYKEVMRQ